MAKVERGFSKDIGVTRRLLNHSEEPAEDAFEKLRRRGILIELDNRKPVITHDRSSETVYRLLVSHIVDDGTDRLRN